MQAEWIVAADAELGRTLAAEFQLGPIINDAGQRLLTEELVARLDGLKIEVFSREHPPPHFRVIYSGETANFAIKDCSFLNGGLTKWHRTIRKWHTGHKPELIAAWNRTRPSDCPVGEYAE